ncbi:ATP-dependent DNA helicase PIF1 [Onthophagus taurus]|uniref:ATP-dependent DNA helicase PIF1 n=1 Tax=Onthophagus taurus TaxID=166361 RepID=UPI0039BDC63D
MSSSESLLSCAINIEWVNRHGVVTRKLSLKSGNLRILRNEHRQMFVEITGGKLAPERLQLKGISVHNKFMNEGKASIKFQDHGCTLFISNAPPGSLLEFLRTIFIKMTGEKTQNKDIPLREQLLSNKQRQFDEISPVTNEEFIKSHKRATKRTETTPSPLSRKRKLSGGESKGAKRLNSALNSFNEALNEEQKRILDVCLSGVNVFFTGSAGTGKSYLLKKIISSLPPDVTVATASTGVAACHIGGITLHQFAGIGNGEATLERAKELVMKPVSAKNWRKCKHLIIDEVSMIDAQFFEKIESVARHVRNNTKPFGGLQLILCGDFFQLPPVKRDIKKNEAIFCFQTPVWKDCVDRTFELTIVHRQSDEGFVKILNSIRIGKVTDEITSVLTSTAKHKIEENGILATRLCSHTNDANVINESRLKALTGESKIFQAQDSDPTSTKHLDQSTPVPGKLILKVGAQVMLLKNINVTNGLVNGARGVIKRFEGELPVVGMRNNKEYVAKPEKWLLKTARGNTISRMQVPLKLAWAFSIHKSQGLTLDCVEMSLARVFEAGQAYVALSRAKSLETLRILDFKSTQVWANQDVVKFYKRLKEEVEMFRVIPLGKKNSFSDLRAKKTAKSINKKLFLDKPLVNIN